jgi:hypothetical protein
LWAKPKGKEWGQQLGLELVQGVEAVLVLLRGSMWLEALLGVGKGFVKGVEMELEWVNVLVLELVCVKGPQLVQGWEQQRGMEWVQRLVCLWVLELVLCLGFQKETGTAEVRATALGFQ